MQGLFGKKRKGGRGFLAGGREPAKTGRCPETGKSARRRCARRETAWPFLFFCALTLAGMNRPSRLFFSPARLADKRAPEPPSCQSPLPKAVPALGIHPASGTTSLFLLKRRPMGHNASSIPDYRGIHQFSQAVSFAIRSTPKMQQHVSALSASPRQGVKRKVFDPSLTPRTAPIATTES